MIPPKDLQHEHQEVLELIPWFLNDTLEEGERSIVQRHLARCVACRDELQEQEFVLGHIATSDTRPERAPAAFAALAERLDAPRARRTGSRTVTLRVAAMLIAALAVWQLTTLPGRTAATPTDEAVAEFVVLADPESCTGDVSVVFDASASEIAVRELLQSPGLEVACGPNAEGLYKLRVTDRALGAEAAVAALLEHEIVALALPSATAGTN